MLSLHVSWKNWPAGSTVALIMHNERIDGIDREGKYTDSKGTQQSGWHRHQWDENEKSCRYRKAPIEDVGGVIGKEEFLTRIFSLMNIRLNRADHGIYELQFD